MLENLTLPTLPPFSVLVPCALAAAGASLVLAACYGPFLAIGSEFLAIRTRRAFYGRFAGQVAQMSLCAGIIAALLAAGTVAWFSMGEPTLLSMPYSASFAVMGGGILLTFTLLCFYVFRTPHKGIASHGHLGVGLATGCAALFSLFCGTGVMRRLLATPPEIDPALPWTAQTALFLGIPWDSFCWSLLIASVPLGLAFAASLAALWLLLMRGRQDYGRDYYAFALPYAAKGALAATPLAVLAGAFTFFRSRDLMLPELSHLPSPLLDILSAVFPLLACLFWIRIIRSQHPMRHKISVAAACLFLLAGFAGQIFMLNKVIPSP